MELLPTKIIYHIFADNRDEYADTITKAKQIFRHFKQEVGNARLYEEIWQDPSDEPVEENCLISFGSYPL